MLSVVGTPIGNLSDAAPRVIQTLHAADLVLCEDTRVTSKLLHYFDIESPLMRCDEHVIASRVPQILSKLEAGQHIAFVSDAGMPAISDPGQRLVDAALDAGFKTEVIPGPSAVTCALVASGLAVQYFFFEGFLPRKISEQTRRLQMLATIPGALVIYESPRRVKKTLDAIAGVYPHRRVALVRELTKLHEEVVREKAPVLAQLIAGREDLRGECVIVIEAPTEAEAREVSIVGATPASVEDVIARGLLDNMAPSALAKMVAQQCGISRSQAYDRIVKYNQES